MTMLFGGVDLTASEKKPTAVALITDQAVVADIRFCDTENRILQAVRNCRLVGLDAPCFLPLGMSLCCFEEPPACDHPPAPGNGRIAEKELRRIGVSAYPITPNSFVKQWIRRGVRVNQLLETHHIATIETYPAASKLRLFNRSFSAKQSRAGREQLQGCLSKILTSMPEVGDHLLSHDELDALLAGVAALFHWRGESDSFGDPEEGVIVLPKSTVYKRMR